MFGLSYLPTAQRLSFSIIKAINLRFESVVSNLESFGEYFQAFEMITKGQLISKCLFGIFNSPKKRMKKFDFTNVCTPEKRTKRSSNILVRLVRFSVVQTLL